MMQSPCFPPPFGGCTAAGDEGYGSPVPGTPLPLFPTGLDIAPGLQVKATGQLQALPVWVQSQEYRLSQ